MRISEIIKCAVDLAELEKQAMGISSLAQLASASKVAPKLIGPGIGRAVQRAGTRALSNNRYILDKNFIPRNQISKPLMSSSQAAEARFASRMAARPTANSQAVAGNSLKLGAPASTAGINTASLGQSGSIIPEVKAVPAMLQNSSRNARISTRPPAMPGANASPAFATNVDTAAASTLPGASIATPTATEAVESAAKASLLDRLKGMSPVMKTGLTVGGAGLAGGGLGAWMNSGSGYDDAMSDAQLMMMNQQRQYEEALGRMQNRGLFDRILNTGG